MAAILWRDANAPQFGDALQGFARSGEAITNALTAAKTGLKDWRDNQTREASADLMADLMTQYTGDPRGLQRDLRSGDFMRGRDTRLLSETALAAIGARQQDLQNFETGTFNTNLAAANATGADQRVAHERGVYGDYRQDREGTVAGRDLLARAGTMGQAEARAMLATPENRAILAAMPREEMTAVLQASPQIAQLMGNVDLTGATVALTRAQELTEREKPAQIRASTGLTVAQTRAQNAQAAGIEFSNDVNAEDRANTTSALGAINQLMREGDISGARRYIEDNWGKYNERTRALIIQNGGAAYPGLFGQLRLGDGSLPNTDPAPTAPPPVQVPIPGWNAPVEIPMPTDSRRPAAARPQPDYRVRPIAATEGFVPEARAPEGQPDVAELLRSAVASSEQPGVRPAAATFGFGDETPASDMLKLASGQRGPRARYPSSAPADRDHSNVPFEAVQGRIVSRESRNAGGYDALAYNLPGGRRNAAGVYAPRPLTQMTMGEVYDFQRGAMRQRTRGFRGQGDVGSTGAGAYQFESGTLRENAQRTFGNNWRNMPFTPANQDRVARTLYERVRGDRAALGATWAAFSGRGSGDAGGPIASASPYGNMLDQMTSSQGPETNFDLIGGDQAQSEQQAPALSGPAQQLAEMVRSQRENPIMPVQVAPVELSRLPSTNVAALIAAAANARRMG